MLAHISCTCFTINNNNNIINNKVERPQSSFLLLTNTEFYGESQESFMLKEFSTNEDLTDIIQLSSQPLPERPDGIVMVAKYSSSTQRNCIESIPNNNMNNWHEKTQLHYSYVVIRNTKMFIYY